MGTPFETPRVEVRLREQPPHGAHERIQAVINRLHSLATTGKIEGFDVKTWDPELSSGMQIEDQTARRNDERSGGVAEFEEWAERCGRTLQPAFERREVTSLLTDETYDTITVPIICLSVYVDDELHCVFPCQEADRTCSITECLDALERGEIAQFIDAPSPAQAKGRPRS